MISIIVETTHWIIYYFPWRYTHVISFGEDAPNLEQNKYKDENYDNIAPIPGDNEWRHNDMTSSIQFYRVVISEFNFPKNVVFGGSALSLLAISINCITETFPRIKV